MKLETGTNVIGNQSTTTSHSKKNHEKQDELLSFSAE